MSRLSKELQIGKAGEHMVCADLILQGFGAFLADAGSPYDVLVDVGTRVLRVQVKTTQTAKSHARSQNHYQFNIRVGKGNGRAPLASGTDYYAFVALDIRAIAYMPVGMLANPDGTVKQIVQFRKPGTAGTRTYASGKTRAFACKRMDDYRALVVA
jgi:hypothetical protein